MERFYDQEREDLPEGVVDLSAERAKRQAQSPDDNDIFWGDFEYLDVETSGEMASKKIIESFDNSAALERMSKEEFSDKVSSGMKNATARMMLIAVGAAALFALADRKDTAIETENIKCIGWTDFTLAPGEPGFSAAIANVEFGEGVTQEAITDKMAQRNGTNNPLAGIVYEVPAACEVTE